MATLAAGAVCLRPLASIDEALYCTLYGSAETMAHIAAAQDAATSARSFRAALGMNAQVPVRRGYWVICAVADEATLGLAGLLRDDEGGAEVGVVLPAVHQGRGHATRAIAALADHAFGAMGCMRLYTRHHEGHAPAAGLMQALGFERLGADETGDRWHWQLTPTRWSHWPRRQGRANPLPSAGLTVGGRQAHD